MLAAAAAAAFLGGCSRPSAPPTATAVTAESLASSAQEEFNRSKYPDALGLIRRARTMTPVSAQPEADRLRLMEAEYLLFSQEEAASLELAGAGLAAVSSALEPRRRMLMGGALRRANPNEALKHLEAAIASAAGLRDYQTAAMGWVFRGQIELDHNRDATQSLVACRQAESMAKAAGDPRPLDWIVPFNLGRSFLELNQFDLAIEVYKTAADRARNRGDADFEARALENLAIGYEGVGDFDRALAFLEKADEIRRANPEKLPKNRIISLGTRGIVLWRLGRRDEALQFLNQAAALARERGEAPELRRRLDGLIEPLVTMGRVDEAEKASAEVFTLYEKNAELAEKARPFSLALRGRIGEVRQRRDEARRDFEKALRLASREERFLRRDAEFGLARLDAAVHRRPEARRHFEAAIKLAEAERAALGTQDAQLTFLETVIDIYRQYAAVLTQWGDEDGALAVEESSRARLAANRIDGAAPPVRTAALRQLAARSRTLFLAYWIAEGGSHVRLIGPQGYERVPLAVNTSRLTELVREHNDLMERQMEDPRRTGRAAAELYRILVEPVASRIPAAAAGSSAGARVVIIPDGALHRLNFETLVRERDGRKGFWIEDVTVQVSPSLSMLQEAAGGGGGSPRQQTRARGGGGGVKRMLLMGDAVPAPDFGRLDHASEEMLGIRRIVSATAEVIEHRGAAAQPSAFAASSPAAFSHIHFTAHAQANRESPLDSAVILSPDQTGVARGRYRLSAREVGQIRLNADTVTISACRSAGDRAVQGEGMVGFAWAFLRAGAGNVVAGLWDVNDRSTLSLMNRFYQGIQAGAPATEALRAAKLALIADGKAYAKPFYWAPFQVYSRAVRTR